MEKMISGIKPTGKITLGNYLGAIKPFVEYQDKYDLSVFIANLHSLTIHIDPDELRSNTDDLISIYLAAGLDPEKVILFKQSDILEHNALEWVLTCNTNLSELTKMPQYKNYLEKNKGKATPSGMLLYPSLMNADILLYEADYVPVGIDQKPHVDLTRDIAEQFNRKYNSDVFKLPKAILTKVGAKIMSLSDPTKKMSKSESDKGTIYLLDDIEVTRKKIMKAKTDGEDKVYYDPINKPGVSNLLVIYASLKNISIEEAVDEFKDISNYGEFKRAVSNLVCEELIKIQNKVSEIKENKGYIEDILEAGRKKAKEKASTKLTQIYKLIGIM